MPVAILVLLIFVGFMISVDTTLEEKRIAIIMFFISVILSAWLILALCTDSIEKERIDYTVHQSPDGYQYITYGDTPINITNVFGRTLSDNEKVQEVRYQQIYYNISFLEKRISKRLEVVEEE